MRLCGSTASAASRGAQTVRNDHNGYSCTDKWMKAQRRELDYLMLTSTQQPTKVVKRLLWINDRYDNANI